MCVIFCVRLRRTQKKPQENLHNPCNYLVISIVYLRDSYHRGAKFSETRLFVSISFLMINCKFTIKANAIKLIGAAGLVLLFLAVIFYLATKPTKQELLAEQIIHSYMTTKGMNIQPQTDEFKLFMRSIIWGEQPELTEIGAGFVNNQEELDYVLSYAWEFSGYKELYSKYREPDTNEAKPQPSATPFPSPMPVSDGTLATAMKNIGYFLDELPFASEIESANREYYGCQNSPNAGITIYYSVVNHTSESIKSQYVDFFDNRNMEHEQWTELSIPGLSGHAWEVSAVYNPITYDNPQAALYVIFIEY